MSQAANSLTTSRRNFLAGSAALFSSIPFSAVARLSTRRLQISDTPSFIAAVQEAEPYDFLDLAPGLYEDDGAPLSVTVPLTIAGPREAILQAEIWVHETTLTINGPHLHQKPRTPNGDTGQFCGHMAAILLDNVSADAEDGAFKCLVAADESNVFIRARESSVAINYGNVAADVIRAWYGSHFMTLTWPGNTCLIEGGATTGGIVHVAMSGATIRGNTILRGVGNPTMAALHGNLSSALLMTGTGSIENCYYGMRAMRNSEGWLDPAIVSSGVVQRSYAMLGSTIT